MADSNKKAQSHLQTNKKPMFWDWWRENPVEIILVIFILVLFFAFPRQGCGITNNGPSPNQPAVDVTTP
jgi:hypothetical protein